MNQTNQDVAKLLRSVAAALTLKKSSIFQVRAYETAADAIEHLTSEVKDLYEEDKLGQIPGVGEGIRAYLEEYFKTGQVKHFESVQKDFDPFLFELLDIPGVGPKTALELSKLGVKSFDGLNKQIGSGELVKRGFSQKIAAKIDLGLKELQGRSGRMLLPYAFDHAQKILEYLKKGPGVVAADPLGSLRRRVVTIGDLDFAAATKKPKELVDYFVKMPGVSRIIDQGENKANVVMNSGLEIDLLVGDPESYGALLQHFTGSKHHNIKLRNLALKKGMSLSEFGVKVIQKSKLKSQNYNSKLKNGETITCRKEEDLYELLGMQTPDPEIREDNGEIEAGLVHKLPKLVKQDEIKGDLHLHSNFPLEPSHGPGINEIEDIVKTAKDLGYEYVGISDHSPSFTNHSKEQIIKLIEKRTKVIQKFKTDLSASRQGTKSIRVLNGLEIDILGDGSLSVPDEALETLDYCIAGIHSGHRGTKEQLTQRILKALESPFVDILSHPTGRLLNQRDSYDADWEVIFKFAATNNKLMEINAFPNRLDLRDDLVKLALSFGVKFVVDTDAHEVTQMVNMPYGVSVARRGWAEAKDIVNTWDWKKFSEWFNI